MATEPASADDLARRIVETAIGKKLAVALAESCTGGLVAAAITEVPGSSAVLERGFVTYSNAAKIELLGVPGDTIARNGAVSEETARAMAEGALRRSRADLAVSVTGIAGPGGGSAAKPVGLVHFALATSTSTRHRLERFDPGLDRRQIRARAAETALSLLVEGLLAAKPEGDPS